MRGSADHNGMPMIGQRFHKLVVIRENGKANDGNRMWECQCDCGAVKTIRAMHLKRGDTRSCGCLLKEYLSTTGTHRMSRTKIYRAWDSMKRRCNDPSSKDYKDYGGRGIVVCDRWVNSFENFYEDMGSRPEGMELDRRDNNGPYSPTNCRWVSKKTNARNRRNNTILTFNGMSLSLPEWAERTGMLYVTLRARIFRIGMSVEDALTVPLRSKRHG